MAAMSGGVDSSLAAALMKEAGYECLGACMILHQNGTDTSKASEAARSLDIPFYTFDFSTEFRERVTDYFVDAYINGKTPNPCVVCNRFIKFGLLLDKAKELGCRFLVTGHYARVEYAPESGRYLLKKGLDAQKDQSYFLYSLNQDQLSRVIFPLGEMRKAEVRDIALKRGLPSARLNDSQDICFIPDGKYAGFIESYTGRSFPKGNFIDTNGNCLGTHEGMIRYTKGQRKGLGISLGEPMYVLGTDPEKNTVTLGTDAELYTDSLEAEELNLISCEHIDGSMRVQAKIRSRHVPCPAVVRQTGADRIYVKFEDPQRAVTPGQAVVLYDGETVVGGATITG